ncbi:Lrp/AsnC family transcriptional regulator [Arthrobacter sp. AB6]|uniref:Lrp/AsnC family transcriptional regulator n=1 Tax=Arthrobacter sp. AB6 TaxID=2962570 RepID=UPI00288199F6|nr:Lrp/AsnC family transcriptional regulator [Arthrobacter sp. AB6]MDT0196490.1 Lrp/AsnC family transcriptional regulator [Arthrobacter sp. AB6]
MKLPALDSTDLKILNVLQDEARLPLKTIAERTGISAAQCEGRIYRLELEGHIGGYTIIRNFPDPATRPIPAVIRIAQEPGRSGHDLQRSMESLPEITTAEHLNADHSILLRVQVPDLDRLNKIISFFRAQSAVLSLEVSTSQPLISHRPASQTIGH